jgi:phosphoribosylformylglycinamidine cyclo-ligase
MALLGGETAEMPDFYQSGEYDLAGFIVGMVDEKKIVNGATIREGDVCIGLPSNGLHTNGYTLARKVAFDVAKLKVGDRVPVLDDTIDRALLKVHRCYAPIILPLCDAFDIHGMAHITGGGLPGNLNRVLPNMLNAEISKRSWPVLPIFRWLEKAGDVDPEDMYHAFNMGIGFVIVAAEAEADAVQQFLTDKGELSYRIGRIIPGDGTVRLV